MSETAKKISVPPSTVSRVEEVYQPQNEALFKVYLQYRDLHRKKNESGEHCFDNFNTPPYDVNYEVRMIVKILEQMPVWNDADDEFRDNFFLQLIDFFKQSPDLTEARVIEQVLVLREHHEYQQEVCVEVNPVNDALAAIYRHVADCLARTGSSESDGPPTNPAIPSKKIAAC